MQGDILTVSKCSPRVVHAGNIRPPTDMGFSAVVVSVPHGTIAYLRD